jgi:7-carboxy-7-deazaguanine synthase
MSERLIITGGEPMMHGKNEAFRSLIGKLLSHGWSIEVETNGTYKLNLNEFWQRIALSKVQFNISPKLPSSGNKFHAEKLAKSIWSYFQANGLNTWLKYVVCSEDDLKAIEELAEAICKEANPKPGDKYAQYLYGDKELTPAMLREHTYLMPEGQTREEQEAKQSDVMRICLKHGYNFSPRLHIMEWDDARGH